MKTLLASLLLLAAATLPLRSAEPADFVVHEWGTFTSVQGVDGVQMDWNPLVAPDLPGFVYDVAKIQARRAAQLPGVPAFAPRSKTGMTCIQRMETPVIYIYTDKPLTIDVAVGFPAGTFTEWFPAASDIRRLPTQGNDRITSAQSGLLQWPAISVVPPDLSIAALPQEQAGSHYYAARETDSALLHVPAQIGGIVTRSLDLQQAVTGSHQNVDVEKFLFYRGVANCQAPLTVKPDEANPHRFTVTNSGSDPLEHLFLCDLRTGDGTFRPIPKLAPGETRTVEHSANEGAPMSALSDRMCQALVAEGLYPKEAAAMVKTWTSAWFAEPGLRVLYTLPRAWTDKTLPLRVSPAPRETVRVMVARAEIITPAMEKALLAQVERYLARPATERPQIVEDTKALGLGRFAEPTLRRIMRSAPRSPQFSALSWELLMATINPSAPEATSPQIATGRTPSR